MKIRTALTLKNTVATATVFLVCLMMVYFMSEHTRSQTFFYDLRGEAVTKAHLFLQNQVDTETMQSIYLNNRNFINEVEVAVYTTDFKMLYHDAIQNDIIKEDPEMMERIIKEKEIAFYVGAYQAIGLIYNFRGTDYVITAAAYDGYGYNNLVALRKTLLLLFVVGLSLLFVVGYFLARSALKPIRDIVHDAEKISGSELDKRLLVKNKKDELGELSMTVNALLDRLEQSFNAQKMFVSNVSHELRTPLAALMGELDLALQKERTVEQYKNAITNAWTDARRMTKLIDGLLNLARADYQKEQIRMQDIRLDELLLDVREHILKAHPDYKISLLFEQEDADDDLLITVKGNLYLLSIAFSNLIENNCKYAADRSSCIQISYWEKWTIVRFSDDGVGMTEEEKKHLFQLFYRGKDHMQVDGYGIGLALTHKIITMHNGNILVHTKQGEGTTFVVELPHI